MLPRLLGIQLRVQAIGVWTQAVLAQVEAVSASAKRGLGVEIHFGNLLSSALVFWRVSRTAG